MNLINQVKELRKSDVRDVVDSRLEEFENNQEWFSELCFCILTANSKAKSAINIQKEICNEGFLNFSEAEVRKVIRKNNHRFHNNKTKFILEARKFYDIKELIKDMSESKAREFIVQNIKGLGYKEASHFLRNVGYKNLAILDRHILNLLKENNYISEIPKTLTKNKYLEIEKIVSKLANKLNMSLSELDLYMWYLKTGEVLK